MGFRGGSHRRDDATSRDRVPASLACAVLRASLMHKSLVLFAPAVLSGLVACATDESGPIEVTVTARQGVALDETSRLTLSLYGSDSRSLSAAPALLLRQNLSVTALPATVELALPPGALDALGESVRAQDVALVVDAVYLDVDGDSYVCDDDLAQDYGLEGPRAFGLGAHSLDVVLKTSTGGCFAMPDEHGGGCGGPESDGL